MELKNIIFEILAGISKKRFRIKKCNEESYFLCSQEVIKF